MKAKENKKIYSLFPSSRRRPATSQEVGLQYAQRLLWKTNVLLTNAPSSAPFSQIFLLSMMLYGIKYPSSQFGSAVLATSSPKVLLTPSLLAFEGVGAGWRDRTAQQQPKHGCVINTILAANTKHSTMMAAMGKADSIPHRPNTA